MVERAYRHLTQRELNRSARSIIIEALELLVRAVGHWDTWPEIEDLDELNPFGDCYFDLDDPDDVFLDDDDFDEFG